MAKHGNKRGAQPTVSIQVDGPSACEMLEIIAYLHNEIL